MIEFCEYVFSGSEERVATFPKHPETLKNTVAAAAWYLLLVINFMHIFSIEPIQHCPPLQIDAYKCAVVGAICVKTYENVFMQSCKLMTIQTGIITVSVLKLLTTQ